MVQNWAPKLTNTTFLEDFRLDAISHEKHMILRPVLDQYKSGPKLDAISCVKHDLIFGPLQTGPKLDAKSHEKNMILRPV